MGHLLVTIKRYYATAALMLLNVLMVFALINLLAVVGYVALDVLWPRTNVVFEKYGGALPEVYPGFSESEINALLNETWGRASLFQPYTMFRERPSTGRFVNVHDAGFRISKDQGTWPPSDSNFNVFLFGGSTTFSRGLPDHQSLASYLQLAMNTIGRRPVKVYNFGAGAFQSTQERIFFQELLVKGFRPHMAVFVDGLNEFAFPHEPMGTKELRHLLEDTPARRFVWLSSKLLVHLPIAQFVNGLIARVRTSRDPERIAASVVEDEPQVRQLVDSVISRYLTNKVQIEAVAKAFCVAAVFVWQPVPYYKYDRTYHPFRSEANKHAEIGYRRFRETLPSGMGDNFLWCADMHEASKERLYVDSAHYTARMSERFANQIVTLMTDRGLLVQQ